MNIWIVLLIVSNSYAQDLFMSEFTKERLDSIKTQISKLEDQVKVLTQTRSYNLYFKKLELEKTRFAYQYEKYVFEEDLMEAENFIDIKTRVALKRNDKATIEYYESYRKNLLVEMRKQSERYQELFKKEKNFKREINKFLNVGDEYSLKRAERMVQLATKYARERNLTETSKYLVKYQGLIQAELYDFYSEYNLMQLANYERHYKKQIEPLIESDSINDIIKAQSIVENCHSYAAINKT
ncbi:MAG: hypothetical protein MI922_16695, partial [Bacteroidales bacterium]|nr:hypothetical protein [Bacteroidales bacterium]